MPNRKALVVLSGGQDSTTCLLAAKSEFEEVHAITFDYGQRHAFEIRAAKMVASLVGVASHTLIPLKDVFHGASPLTDATRELRTYPDPEAMAKAIGDRVEDTFVPLRNLLFLAHAASHAIGLGIDTLITGVCQEDNANYPDCTGTFVYRMEHAIREALGQYRPDYKGKLFSISAPLLYKTKAATVQFASRFPMWREALALSHTCYAGQVPPCGVCHACLLRAEGFRIAGYTDPLVERFKQSGAPA